MYLLYRYVTYIFNGYKENLNKYYDAILKYALHCEGYSRYSHNNLISNLNTRWSHVFLPRNNAFRDSIDFSKRINEKRNILHELPISTCKLHVVTSSIDMLQV